MNFDKSPLRCQQWFSVASNDSAVSVSLLIHDSEVLVTPIGHESEVSTTSLSQDPTVSTTLLSLSKLSELPVQQCQCQLSMSMSPLRHRSVNDTSVSDTG